MHSLVFQTPHFRQERGFSVAESGQKLSKIPNRPKDSSPIQVKVQWFSHLQNAQRRMEEINIACKTRMQDFANLSLVSSSSLRIICRLPKNGGRFAMCRSAMFGQPVDYPLITQDGVTLRGEVKF